MNTYAKYDPNIPCGSRVMSIFTNWSQLTEMMLSKTLSIKNGHHTCQWLDNVDMHLYANFNQICHVVQEFVGIFTN